MTGNIKAEQSAKIAHTAQAELDRLGYYPTE